MVLTRRAILLLLFAAPLIAAATWLPLMHWAAVIYLLLCVAFFVLDFRAAEPLERLVARRNHAQKLSLGAENPVILSLHNRGRRTVKFQLRDEPPDEFQVRAPDSKNSSQGGRLHAATIAPREEWQGRYTVRPFRRGNYRFGNLTLRWEGPMGLIVRQATLPASVEVRVYPNLLDVQRYDLLLRRNRLQEMGLQHSRQRGQGTEYTRLREYLPDDDFRHIHWKSTARRNRPVTVEYETERSQNVFLAIDIGRMMQSPVGRMAKLDYVINTSLLLTYVATGKGDKVGLMTFADQVNAFLSPKQGQGQFYRALEILYAVEAQPVEPDYGQALSYLALKQRKRSLIVLFTDLTGGKSMEMLASQAAQFQRTHLLLVVTIADPDVIAAAHQQPGDSLAAYQRAAAGQLLEDRQITLDRLRQHGAFVLDTPANRLSTEVINRYLELKAQTRL